MKTLAVIYSKSYPAVYFGLKEGDYLLFLGTIKGRVSIAVCEDRWRLSLQSYPPPLGETYFDVDLIQKGD